MRKNGATAVKLASTAPALAADTKCADHATSGLLRNQQKASCTTNRTESGTSVTASVRHRAETDGAHHNKATATIAETVDPSRTPLCTSIAPAAAV
jgi:hypothetical protein